MALSTFKDSSFYSRFRVLRIFSVFRSPLPILGSEMEKSLTHMAPMRKDFSEFTVQRMRMEIVDKNSNHGSSNFIPSNCGAFVISLEQWLQFPYETG